MNGLLLIIIENNQIKKKCNSCNQIWDSKLLEICPTCIPNKCYQCLWKFDSGRIKRFSVCNECTNNTFY